VVVIAHRPSALAGVDQLLIMGNGQAQAFGPKDEVMKALAPKLVEIPKTQTRAGSSEHSGHGAEGHGGNFAAGHLGTAINIAGAGA
jgi:hypothetical protein